MCSCSVCFCRQEISWKEARSLLKLGNPAEYYRSFKERERRLCHGAKRPDTFIKVEIFSPQKDSPIVLRGGATIEFTDDNVALFKGGVCCSAGENCGSV